MKISTATVAVWLAFASPAASPQPQPVPTKCCGECKGTGMVPTGDGISRVSCRCPDSCQCAKNRPKVQCVNGNCNVHK